MGTLAKALAFCARPLVIAGCAALSIALFVACAGCASPGLSSSQEQDSASTVHVVGTYEQADLSGYPCFRDSRRPMATYRNVTVPDVEKEIEAGSTFVLFVGYEDCPWCNALLPSLDEAAAWHGVPMLYIDARANPAWKSNMDIDGYDTFVSLFGNRLQTDGDGRKHLYVPHVFFVKDGVVAEDHTGTVPSQENPGDALTQGERDELEGVLDGKFASLL